MLQKIQQTLCPQCMRKEIRSWANELGQKLEGKARIEINNELKNISITPGECIVCNHNKISEDAAVKILRILEENNVKEEIKNEFKRYFCI